MKKFKSAMVAALSGVMLLSSCTFFASNVKAAELSDEEEYLKLFPRSVFEVNASEILIDYAKTQTGTPTYIRYRVDANDSKLIPVYSYKADGTLLLQDLTADKWHDGTTDAVDSASILSLSSNIKTVGDTTEVEGQPASWIETADDLIYSLAKYLNISKDDITLSAKVIMQKYEGFNDAEQSFVISSATGVTAENIEKASEFTLINNRIFASLTGYEFTSEADLFEYNARVKQNAVEVTLATKSGAEYKMVIADDNNFYLTQTKAEPQKEFKTTLEYTSEVQGKTEGDTYLPPYYANEEKNAKKDLDATAIIRSTTTEEIIKTNGVELTADGKANSEGWYYLDVNDKTVIAKVYPFDDYNNTKDNGAVKETVQLTGAEGGEDSQSPSIRWTFRLIDRTDTENEDGSLTVTLTYNLPVDPESIPEGWAPIYDEDGTTIHKITKTIKKGEDYDKDVTVERNGPIDEKVTTHVKKVWEKLSPVLPQTGIFSVVLVVIVAGAAAFAITRYRKIVK